MPLRLSTPLFSAMFLTYQIVALIVIHDAVLLCNFGFVVQIKLFQLIKSLKLEIDFHQQPYQGVSTIIAWSQDKLKKIYL